MSTELTMAMTRQWERDYHAWLTDPGSGLAPLELLGRAANRIAELSRLVTEQAVPPGCVCQRDGGWMSGGYCPVHNNQTATNVPLPGLPGSRFSPADFAQSRAAAGAPAWDAARAAARDALAPTVRELQQSALALFDAMLHPEHCHA